MADYISMMVEYIITRRGGALYHMTDESSLASIAEHGLLSKQEAEARSIVCTYPGGDGLTRALDRDYGLWDYVFLGFNKSAVMPKHAGEERDRRPRLLHIDPNVLHRHGVKIALGRANHRGTKVYKAWWAIQQMDHEIFAGDYDPNDIMIRWRVHQVFNYEILVPKTVPVEYIMAVETPE